MTPLDWRLAFLARAGARFQLVMSGDLELDDAITGLIGSIDRRWLLERIVRKRPLPCACECDVLGRWEKFKDAPPRGKVAA